MSPPGPNHEYSSRSDFDSGSLAIYPKLDKLAENSIPNDVAIISADRFSPKPVDSIESSIESQEDKNSYSEKDNRILVNHGRKGWKGLSSLEKSLYVALGVVSSVCIALMIAVIVLGVQRNDCKSSASTSRPSSTTTTPFVPPGTTPNYCDGPIPERPRRRSTSRKGPGITTNITLFNSQAPYRPVQSAECISDSYQNSTICLTPQCFERAGQIIQSMNRNVNPCENFYEFSCGNWGKSNPKPEYMEYWGPSEILQWKRLHDIKGELEKDHSLFDTRSLRSAKQFYHSCMHPADDEVGVAEIRLLLEEMIPNFEDGDIMQSFLARVLAQFHRSTNDDSIISLSVEMGNNRNRTESYFILGQPKSGTQMLMDRLNRQKLFKYPRERTGVQINELYEKLGKKLWSIVFPEDVETLEEKLTDTFHFERILSTISSMNEGNSNKSEDLLDEPLKVNDTHLSSEMTSWLIEFAEKVMGEEDYGVLEGDEDIPIIMLRSEGFFVELERLMNETEVGALVKYLRLRMLLDLGSQAGTVFRKAFKEFEDMVFEDVTSVPRWMTCAQEANDFFGWTLSLRTTPTLEAIQIRKNILESVAYIKEALNETLDGVYWIKDDKSRRFAQQKIELMQTNLGFPEWWLTDKSSNNEDTFVEQFYADVNFTDPNNFFQNYVETLMWMKDKKFSRRNNDPTFDINVDDMWPEWKYSTDTESFYSDNLNALTVPIGIVDWSSASTDEIAPSLQYGSRGFSIAENMLDAILKKGMYRGMTGESDEWWDKQTIESYQNVMNCFEKQLNEDLGDNASRKPSKKMVQDIASKSGALIVAYNAYHSKTFEDAFDEVLLPGLQDYTPEQLFFVSYAQNMCVSAAHNEHFDEALKGVLHTVLRNSVEFAKQWKCALPKEENVCRVF